MKLFSVVIGVLFSVFTLTSANSFADENRQGDAGRILAMCDCQNNPQLCARVQESVGLQRDQNGAQEHRNARGPASFGPPAGAPNQFNGGR